MATRSSLLILTFQKPHSRPIPTCLQARPHHKLSIHLMPPPEPTIIRLPILKSLGSDQLKDLFIHVIDLILFGVVVLFALLFTVLFLGLPTLSKPLTAHAPAPVLEPPPPDPPRPHPLDFETAEFPDALDPLLLALLPIGEFHSAHLFDSRLVVFVVLVVVPERLFGAPVWVVPDELGAPIEVQCFWQWRHRERGPRYE